MGLQSFKETEAIENNVCIGHIGSRSIVMDELGKFYFYDNPVFKLEIGECIETRYITGIETLTPHEQESMLKTIYETLL